MSTKSQQDLPYRESVLVICLAIHRGTACQASPLSETNKIQSTLQFRKVRRSSNYFTKIYSNNFRKIRTYPVKFFHLNDVQI